MPPPVPPNEMYYSSALAKRLALRAAGSCQAWHVLRRRRMLSQPCGYFNGVERHPCNYRICSRSGAPRPFLGSRLQERTPNKPLSLEEFQHSVPGYLGHASFHEVFCDRFVLPYTRKKKKGGLLSTAERQTERVFILAMIQRARQRQCYGQRREGSTPQLPRIPVCQTTDFNENERIEQTLGHQSARQHGISVDKVGNTFNRMDRIRMHSSPNHPLISSKSLVASFMGRTV